MHCSQESTVMVFGFQWSLCSAVVLLSVHAAPSPHSLQGLSCLNDFVRSVTCTWRHGAFRDSSDCRVSGVKVTYVFRDNKREVEHLIQSCKLQQQNGKYPGCTFSFDRTFNSYEKMPNISVTCNHTLMENVTNYSPKNHIKMHPPGSPNVSSSENLTRISWTPGEPRAGVFKSFYFQVQIKHLHQSWNEVKSEPTEALEMVVWRRLEGLLQVRVRVRPDRSDRSHWSDWSPVTSWTSQNKEESSQAGGAGGAQQLSYGALTPGEFSLFLGLTSALSLGLFSASLLALYRCCKRKRFMEEKTVPNPSKYFCTLHSVHGGNLKKWLNPESMSDSFFVSCPRVDISAVEVCQAWDVEPSSCSPCSTSGLLQPSVDNPRSSCSSSCFSNMGYFMSSEGSSSSSSSSRPYFTYKDTSHRRPQLSLCPPLTSLSIYESLRREPQSPDSGFGVGRLEDQDVEVLEEDQSCPLLQDLPLSVSSFPPVSLPFPSDVNLVFDNQGLEEDGPPAASPAVSGTFSAWPGAEPMSRASSLPVDTCKSGYLTLKELQATFSNKSI